MQTDDSSNDSYRLYTISFLFYFGMLQKFVASRAKEKRVPIHSNIERHRLTWVALPHVKSLHSLVIDHLFGFALSTYHLRSNPLKWFYPFKHHR